MNHQSNSFRGAFALFLAAATAGPLLAQDSQTNVPVVDVPPVPKPSDGDPAPSDAPDAPAVVPTINPPPVENEEADEPRASVPPPANRSEPRAATRPASTRDIAGAPAAEASASADPVPAPADEPGAGEQSPAGADAQTSATSRPLQPQEREDRAIWPWLLAGLLAIGALVGFLYRRRSRERLYEEPYSAQPVMAEPAPVIAAPLVETAAPASAPAAAIVGEPGRPRIYLTLVPVRAGIEDGKLRAEFHLTVDNQGTLSAHDVRIATWMCLAGPDQSTIDAIPTERPPGVMLPEIEAGDAKRIAAAVALPREAIGGSSALPVVVAEACYPLDDGSEARTTASFAVGVPLEGELAHFDLDNPSGLHGGLEARAVGEPKQA